MALNPINFSAHCFFYLSDDPSRNTLLWDGYQFHVLNNLFSGFEVSYSPLGYYKRGGGGPCGGKRMGGGGGGLAGSC